MGTRTVGDVVSFNVAAGTGSFSIVSQAMNASASDVTFIFGGQDITVPNSVVPVIVSQPDGTTFYDDNAAPPSDPATALAAYAGLTPFHRRLNRPQYDCESQCLRRRSASGNLELQGERLRR